jgi:hypothetical protein
VEVLSLDIQARYASVEAARQALDKYQATLKATAAMDAVNKIGTKSTNEERNAAGMKVAQAQMAALAINERKAKLDAAAEAKRQSEARKQEAELAKVAAKETATHKRAEADATRDAVKEGAMLSSIYQKIADYAVRAVAFTIKLGLSLAQFALFAADSARSNTLFAEAAAGSTLAGSEQVAVVNQLARNVPVARERIDELAKSYLAARLRGREMQAATVAMVNTIAAMGDSGASNVDAIIKQSAAMRRFYIGARDIRGEFAMLQGTGLKAVDIYNAVAKTMGISVAEAMQRVQRGTIPLQKGLEALEAATQNKFGNIITRQMIGLQNQLNKGRENFGLLFSKVDIGTFLAKLAPVIDLLSAKTYTGYALQQAIGKGLTALADGASNVLPLVRGMLIGAAIAGLNLATGLILIKRRIDEFEKSTGLDKLTDGMDKAGTAANMAQIAVSMIAFAATQSFAGLDAAMNVIEKISKIDLTDIGMSIVKSLAIGMGLGAPDVASAASSLASLIPTSIANRLVMHSPSVLITKQTETGVGGAMKLGLKKSGVVARDAAAEAASKMSQGIGAGMQATAQGSQSATQEVRLRVDLYRDKEFIRSVFFNTLAQLEGNPIEVTA